MKHYAGLDLSMETTQVCMIDETGRKIAAMSVESAPDRIAHALREIGDVERAVIETGRMLRRATDDTVSPASTLSSMIRNFASVDQCRRRATPVMDRHVPKRRSPAFLEFQTSISSVL